MLKCQYPRNGPIAWQHLSATDVASLAAAKEKGVPVIAYGSFINVMIEFVIVAFALFMIVKMMNKLRKA